MENPMAFTKPATALSVLVCLMLSATAFADTSDIKASNNQFGFQFISTNVDYTETGNGQFGSPTGTLDTETGRVPGNAISISMMKDLWFGNDYIEAEYDHSSGNTKYVGGYIGPPATPYGSVVGTSSATLTNYSARYGIGQIINYADDESTDDLMLTYYVELGHHEWDRGVNLGETYTHNHFGIGALGQYSPVRGLVFSANAMIGSTFGSNIDVVGAFSGALGNSALYKAGVGADYAFVQNLHGNIGIDYTSFDYGISAVYPVGGGYIAWEPDSSTSYTTVRIGLGYAF
jgi:opacity protein-like surface antigen